MALINSDVVPFTGGAYEIEQSLRFNDDDSPYLGWTPSSEGNRRTWTMSMWVKRGNIGLEQTMFSAGPASTGGWTGFRFYTNDTFGYTVYGVGSTASTAVFRDVSAWYHIVIRCDTTLSSNRVKIYFNNELIHETDYSFSQDEQTYFNSTYLHRISSHTASVDQHFDGYMAEVHFIDGQALDPTSFGKTGTYGEWKPIEYTGTYGTNGFYLDFDGTYYNDKSGNGNNFTANNLATTDVVLDSPTNNFATLNSVCNDATLSEGNLKATTSSTTSSSVGSMGVTSGKWYFETVINTFGNAPNMGVHALSDSGDLSYSPDGYALYVANGNIIREGYSNTSVSSATNGDIIGTAVDLDANTIQFYKNGVSLNSALTLPTASQSGVIPRTRGNSTAVTFNFGQDSSFAGTKTAQGNTDSNNKGDFYYTPPSGYLALCTANLPEPAVIPSENFNTVLYTGTGSTQSITGVGFAPDLVWMKHRTQGFRHELYDKVRGTQKPLMSNLTEAEGSVTNGLSSFDSDGWTMGDRGQINFSSQNHVGWNWKANGSGSSNTNGSITTTVSANQDAGFSIVTWSGNSTNGSTLGHGLSSAPEFITIKCRSRGDEGWWTQHTDLSSGQHYLRLDNTSSQSNAGGNIFNDFPTSSVFKLQDGRGVNQTGETYVAYCFHSVDGYSKVGSYTGNGSTDGTFVYTGFRPAYVMVKRTDTLNGWFIKDIQRGTYSTGTELAAHHAGAEGTHDTNYVLDFVSNGFKFRNSGGGYNGSGGTYIYIAFAEHPFKYTNAR